MIHRLTRIAFLSIFILTGLVAQPGRTAAGSIEEYRKTGVSVVHSVQSQPLYFMGNEGRPMGLLVDYWQRWSVKTGIPVTFRIAPWKETLRMVASGEVDINGGLAKTQERLEFLDYSNPFLTITMVLLVEGKEEIDPATIYADSTIGVVNKTLPESFIRERYPNAKVTSFDTPEEVVVALAQNEIDAVSMDLPSFQFNNAKLAHPMAVTVSDILAEVPLHAGVRKGNTPLVQIINDGFADFTDTEHHRLTSRWFIPDETGPSWPRILAWISLGTLILGVIIYFVIRPRRPFSHKSRQP